MYYYYFITFVFSVSVDTNNNAILGWKKGNDHSPKYKIFKIMKKLVLFFLVILCTTCIKIGGLTTEYQCIEDKDIKIEQFVCEQKNEMTVDHIVRVYAKEFKQCVIDSADKIIWLNFWFPYCTETVMPFVEYAKEYKDKFELYIIIDTYAIEEVQKEIQKVRHQIYYIDNRYNKKRNKNRASFVYNLFDEEVDKWTGYSSHVFIKEGKLIKTAFNKDISDVFLKSL